MRQPTWGPIVRQRVKGFLAAILLYAEEQKEERDFLYRWEERDSLSQRLCDRPKLVIETNRRCLQRLSNLSQNQIYEVIKTLKNLDILEDNRTQTQGTEDWRFTLYLWSHNSGVNLSKFEREWDNNRPKRSIALEVVSANEIAPNRKQDGAFSLAISLGYGSCIPRLIPPRLAS